MFEIAFHGIVIDEDDLLVWEAGSANAAKVTHPRHEGARTFAPGTRPGQPLSQVPEVIIAESVATNDGTPMRASADIRYGLLPGRKEFRSPKRI
jgi:hypothetical protein